MFKAFYLLAIAAFCLSFRSSEENFAGKIIYQYQFTDLAGKDITDKLAPYVGREQHYFINAGNYKSYDEHQNLMQLYNAATNQYYAVGKDKTAKKYDAAEGASQQFEVKHLTVKEKIAGYPCKAVQITTEGATTVYYYSPKIKVDTKLFAGHNFGDWKKYLEITGGSLTLKYVLTDSKNGFVWTTTATKVERVNMPETDFQLPQDITLAPSE